MSSRSSVAKRTNFGEALLAGGSTGRGERRDVPLPFFGFWRCGGLPAESRELAERLEGDLRSFDISRQQHTSQGVRQSLDEACAR